MTAATPVVIDLGVVAAYRPTGLTPASGTQGTSPVVKLTGDAFSTSLEVKLTRAGADPIAGTIADVAADRKSMDVTFPLGQAAPGSWTLTLDRQYGPHAEVANAVVINAPQLRATAAPRISGAVVVGSAVRTTPGTWSPAASSHRYQWLANGAAITGATKASLTVPASAAGKRLTVRVTAVRAGHRDGVAVSPRDSGDGEGQGRPRHREAEDFGYGEGGQDADREPGVVGAQGSLVLVRVACERKAGPELGRSHSEGRLRLAGQDDHGDGDGRSTSASVKVAK